jgi:hypothetical protein
VLSGSLSPQHGPGLVSISEGTLPKFSIYFEKVLSRAHGDFEEQNKILGVFHELLITAFLLINIIN